MSEYSQNDMNHFYQYSYQTNRYSHETQEEYGYRMGMLVMAVKIPIKIGLMAVKMVGKIAVKVFKVVLKFGPKIAKAMFKGIGKGVKIVGKGVKKVSSQGIPNSSASTAFEKRRLNSSVIDS